MFSVFTTKPGVQIKQQKQHNIHKTLQNSVEDNSFLPPVASLQFHRNYKQLNKFMDSVPQILSEFCSSSSSSSFSTTFLYAVFLLCLSDCFHPHHPSWLYTQNIIIIQQVQTIMSYICALIVFNSCQLWLPLGIGIQSMFTVF